jgi:phosphatidylglycerol:prolipoprotein diacylglycerol transferase
VTVDINPIVLGAGPLAVRWFGLLALVGLGLGMWLSLRELDRQKLGRRLALDALAWGLPAAVACARLVYVTGYWDYYLTNAAALWQLNVDDLALWGGLLGGMLVAAARLRRDAYMRRRIFDAVAPNVAFGIAVGQLGAFLDGHGQGVPAALPWATQYAHRLAATPDFGVARHPAQVYEALIALAVGGLLLCMPRRWPAGTRLAAFLVLFGGARALLSGIELEPVFLFGLQIEQLLAMGAVGLGLVYGVRPLVNRRWRAAAAITRAASGAGEDPIAA